jgi:hypothetical protein
MIEYNKSVKFLLPYLCDNNGRIIKCHDFYNAKLAPERNFINSYCFDETKEDNKFYLLYNLDDRSIYEIKLKAYLIRNKFFINCYYPCEGYEMFIFEYPERYLDLRQKFLKGQYSKILPKDKTMIYEFSNLLRSDTFITDHRTVGVLEKLDWRKKELERFINEGSKFHIEITNDMEYESSPDLEKETFKVEDFKPKTLLLT